jgi:hypothetical protein
VPACPVPVCGSARIQAAASPSRAQVEPVVEPFPLFHTLLGSPPQQTPHSIPSPARSIVGRLLCCGSRDGIAPAIDYSIMLGDHTLWDGWGVLVLPLSCFESRGRSAHITTSASYFSPQPGASPVLEHDLGQGPAALIRSQQLTLTLRIQGFLASRFLSTPTLSSKHRAKLPPGAAADGLGMCTGR